MFGEREKSPRTAVTGQIGRKSYSGRIMFLRLANQLKVIAASEEDALKALKWRGKQPSSYAEAEKNEVLWIFFGVHTANAIRIAKRLAQEKLPHIAA